MAETALEKLRRHGWFPQEAVVPFALFSDLLGTVERKHVAGKLRSCPPPSQPLQPQLHVFPDVTRETTLPDLIGERSYMLFNLLGLSCSWLTLPSAEWDKCPDYIQARAFVTTVKTTNDVAERGGGKLLTDFSQLLTKDELKRSWLLQGVENSRRKYADFRKATLNKR